ncbi:YMD3-like protein [Mya arenaria]|uniref:YMD3-like protein n=1 Tax=Mya arenaria TaxID=6604 RepID=A0ABY7FI51_MYAAR|nr:YMD3-like protein [Mya arenaria]
MHRIRKFLHDQESYSLHKPVRRRFQRNHVISAGKDDLWMADLIDMVKFSDWNEGYKYILLVIDTFSKYKFFDSSKRSHTKLITDKGQEFKARKVQDIMKKEEIYYFPTQNETKASTSERAILTIKTRLSRYFSYKETSTFLPVLQDTADNYNHTYHRTIGMRPVDVTDNNLEEVRLATYFAQNPIQRKTNTKLKPFKFKIGDYVRISHLKIVFSRAYDQNYSGEVFKVYKRYYRGTLPIYRLTDLQDEDIKGLFYQSELQKINIDLDQKWTVEKVLKPVAKEAINNP